MRPKEIHQEIARILENKPDAADRILRPLLGLHGLIRQHKLTVDQVVYQTRARLAREPLRFEREK